MNYASLKKDDLRYHLFSLMDQVAQHLQTDPDVDKFLDNTDIFEEWEKALPEPEYPIFIMAVLNNMRRDSIINAILDALIPIGIENIDLPATPLRIWEAIQRR